MNRVRITVYKPIKNIEEKKDIKQPLLWYDTFYKKMLNFDATALDFDYRPEKYIELNDGSRVPESEATDQQKKEFAVQEIYLSRPKPRIEQRIIRRKEIDNDVLSDVTRDFDPIDETKETMVFSIPKNEEDDLVFILERKRLNYEIK
jgi:hypothetical protein